MNVVGLVCPCPRVDELREAVLRECDQVWLERVKRGVWNVKGMLTPNDTTES